MRLNRSYIRWLGVLILLTLPSIISLLGLFVSVDMDHDRLEILVRNTLFISIVLLLVGYILFFLLGRRYSREYSRLLESMMIGEPFFIGKDNRPWEYFEEHYRALSDKVDKFRRIDTIKTEKIVLQKELIHRLAEEIQAPLLIIDQSVRIIHANSAAGRYLGLKPHFLLDRELGQIFDADSCLSVRDCMDRGCDGRVKYSIRTGKPRGGEAKIKVILDRKRRPSYGIIVL